MKAPLPDTSPQAIGRRLATVRAARGLNQSALARALEVSPQRWGQYERGERMVPPDMLARFWQLTGATADYILFERLDGLPFELATRLVDLGAPESRQSA